MGINIFRRPFVIRRFGPEEEIDGHSIAPYTDITTILNVQPNGPQSQQAEPEGARRTRKLKAYGDFQVKAGDQEDGSRGDWLYYRGKYDPQGHWYECTSAIGWDHTILTHCKSEWVQVASAEAYSLDPPGGIEDDDRGA